MPPRGAGSVSDKPRAPSPAAEPGSWERLDQLLKELPSGYPILPPEDRDDFSKYQNPGPPVISREEAWQNCARAIEKHDTDLCNGYREEIDTLLVFAGLFSAVVTAFTIESYQWLQDDPNDAIIGLLSQIARSGSLNNSETVAVRSPSGLPGPASARINAFWFLSLTLSLSAALVAILCKQWIREFERYSGLSSQDYVSVRQLKHEGFQRYGVGSIILALPLLLQLSLAVFSLGVLELLWRLHTGVAIAVGVPAFLALAFYMATTLMPAIQVVHCMGTASKFVSQVTQCPYKSPQAFLIIRACVAVATRWRRVKGQIQRAFVSALGACSPCIRFMRKIPVPRKRYYPRPKYYSSWIDWDVKLHWAQRSPDYGTSSYARGLNWLHTSSRGGDIRNSIWSCQWHEVLLRKGQPRPRDYSFAFCTSEPESVLAHRIETLDDLIFYVYPCTTEFMVEVFAQNLALLDPSSAKDLCDAMYFQYFQYSQFGEWDGARFS
ncbi:hypothetical protein AURDEDRAFT_187574 [Auricularia subglabra TFB-10046 SS5]|nr:hypothetical protein AURDEDRAFT_187574 [Auricularia subglabra TFB-10046 SS5]